MKAASSAANTVDGKPALIRSALLLAALPLAVTVIGTASAASDGVACVRGIDPDSQLERLPECMRVGRHVRVGPSVSRGAATLGDGYVTTGLSDGTRNVDRRLSAPPNPLTILPSLFPAQ